MGTETLLWARKRFSSTCYILKDGSSVKLRSIRTVKIKNKREGYSRVSRLSDTRIDYQIPAAELREVQGAKRLFPRLHTMLI